ncbi:MAG: hypothetical protein KC493_17000 [Bacteriovoracaceae bacterium]|nr:hypothetical protein [Bacteriovoracaceae bacterium]
MKGRFVPGNTAEFLKLFGSESNKYTFQVLPDSSRCEVSPRSYYGSFEKYEHLLRKQNRNGAGIFFVPNETLGKSRKTSDVVSVRALWVDSDDGPIKGAKMPFDVVVKTKNGEHGYVFLGQNECSLEAFSYYQKMLAERLNTDPKVSDLPRLMRLPFYFHCKDFNNRFLVRCI